MTKQVAAQTRPRREGLVSLSRIHDGQIIEHFATMIAEGHWYTVEGWDCCGNRNRRFRTDRWQAVHHSLDLSTMTVDETASPWVSSQEEAEVWLESRGLLLGGEYRMSSPE